MEVKLTSMVLGKCDKEEVGTTAHLCLCQAHIPQSNQACAGMVRWP